MAFIIFCAVFLWFAALLTYILELIYDMEG